MLTGTTRVIAGPARTEAVVHIPARRGILVEQAGIRQLAAIEADWADLSARALERNIFLEPAFALPLVQHIAIKRAPEFVLVWETRGVVRELIGLFSVTLPRLAVLGLARGFAGKQVSLGTPLLDRERARTAFTALLDWVAEQSPHPRALVLTCIPAGGSFMRTIVADLGRTRRVEVLASYRRAVLRPPQAGNGLALGSAKRRKERNRQRRRLAEQGTRAYSSACTPDAVARATERFLALEQKGWKGARGTALLAHPALAAFTRTMTRLMAEQGKCRIDALEIDGQAVAMGIVLTSGDAAYFWKTAFDQTLAPLSPGVQFAIDLAERQIGQDGIALTDSCAIPDHPMIDKIWPDRLEMIDLAVATKAGVSIGLPLSLAFERTRRRLREQAKKAWLRSKRRRT